MSDQKPPKTTTDSGVPATTDEFSLTVGPQGPIALHDHYWASVDPGLGARVAAGLGHGDGRAGGGSNGASAEASELLAARANRA